MTAARTQPAPVTTKASTTVGATVPVPAESSNDDDNTVVIAAGTCGGLFVIIMVTISIVVYKQNQARAQPKVTVRSSAYSMQGMNTTQNTPNFWTPPTSDEYITTMTMDATPTNQVAQPTYSWNPAQTMETTFGAAPPNAAVFGANGLVQNGSYAPGELPADGKSRAQAQRDSITGEFGASQQPQQYAPQMQHYTQTAYAQQGAQQGGAAWDNQPQYGYGHPGMQPQYAQPAQPPQYSAQPPQYAQPQYAQPDQYSTYGQPQYAQPYAQPTYM